MRKPSGKTGFPLKVPAMSGKATTGYTQMKGLKATAQGVANRANKPLKLGGKTGTGEIGTAGRPTPDNLGLGKDASTPPANAHNSVPGLKEFAGLLIPTKHFSVNQRGASGADQDGKGMKGQPMSQSDILNVGEGAKHFAINKRGT